MVDIQILQNTRSICPVCLKQIPAERIRREKEVFIRKNCEEHGDFESIIWRGFSEFDNWVNPKDNIEMDNTNCPDDCGLCSNHLQKTCCVLINITDRCNLNCSFCLANQGNKNNVPTLEEIQNSLSKIIEKDKTLLQLSGGEPTMRDDLPEIIKLARNTGAKYVQLNTNGIRLAEDIQFVKQLAEAGLSFVFMQFDGTDDAIYEKLRNRKLLEIKKQAIENCSAFNIGVTLVPTVVRNINLNNIGEIIRFAISQSPKVRGIHFQPVSFFGKIPHLPENSDRITLDELVYEIEKQSEGLIKAQNILPSSCDHPLCGFHGDFIVEKNNLIPLLNRENASIESCCNSNAAEKNRNFVARRWLRPSTNQENSNSCCGNLQDMDYFLKQIKNNGFTITSMAFQDAGNIDFSRLRKCSFHVFENDKLIPFCAYNRTSWKL